MEQRSACSPLVLAAGSAFALAPLAIPQLDVVDTYHGVQVHDPNRRLEQGDAVAVKQWIEARNTCAERVMGGFKDAKAIAERGGALALTSTQRTAPEIVANTLFHLRQMPPQPQPVLVAEHGQRGGEAKVLVDTHSYGPMNHAPCVHRCESGRFRLAAQILSAAQRENGHCPFGRVLLITAPNAATGKTSAALH